MRNNFQFSIFNFQTTKRGYTLIELIVAIGLFALIMTLASGAYLIMIGANRQVQGAATGVDNLAFALEDMTRSIRTGTGYSSTAGNSFTFTDANQQSVTFTVSTNPSYCAGSSAGCLVETKGGVTSPLTDASVSISSLSFRPTGTARGDSEQARVTIVVSGFVSVGPGKTQGFTVETGATMRGTDI